VSQRENGEWTCMGGHVSSYPEFRYLCRLNVLDHTETRNCFVLGANSKATQSLWNIVLLVKSIYLCLLLLFIINIILLLIILLYKYIYR
jgi:hypothetical protein